LRRALVVSQVALTLVLLVGSLLFVGSLRKLAHVETGFRKENVLIVDMRFVRANPGAVQIHTYQKRLLDKIGAIPGVLSVADTTIVPISGTSRSNAVWMQGRTPADAMETFFSAVSPQYFATLGTPVRAGREFNDRDTPSSPRVAIVNAEFANRVAKSPNPIGSRFLVEATPSTPETEYEIVGIVANTKYLSLHEQFRPIAFLPLAQDPHPSLQDQLILRTSLAPAQLLPTVSRAITEVDGDAHFVFNNLDRTIYASLSRERLMAILSTAFGVLAGVLSAIGLYGMISYVVARRRSEIGVRMALGANRRNIHAMILRESGRVLAVGLAMGIPLSIAAAALAHSLLYGLKPYDPGVLATSALLLTLVAFFAAWFPARRAALLDPMSALRED
jgi:predicted permease